MSSLLVAGVVCAQIHQAPEYSKPGGFKKSDVATAIDSAAHTSGQKSESAKAMAKSLGPWLQEARLSPLEQERFEAANRLFERGDLAGAARGFEAGTKQFAVSLRFQVGLAIAQYAQGKYDDAAAALLRAAKRHPRQERLIPYFMELVDASLPSYLKVAQQLERYANELPKSGAAQLGWALCLMQSEDWVAAEKRLIDAVRLLPADARARMELGKLYEGQGKKAEAVREYLDAVRLDSGQAQGHYRLSQLYLQLKDLAAAEEYLRKYRALKGQ